jgi:hypothetical protein
VSLAAGDMAVVVLSADATTYDRTCGLAGTVVVLIRICDCDSCVRQMARNLRRGPLWVCSGIYSPWHTLYERSLRKIPPADMGMDVLTEEEVTV